MDTRGLYHKFDVRRTDGTDAPGGKHENCWYFVLDLSHDPHAYAAIRAYAESCASDRPALASDLRRHLHRQAFVAEVTSHMRPDAPGSGGGD